MVAAAKFLGGLMLPGQLASPRDRRGPSHPMLFRFLKTK